MTLEKYLKNRRRYEVLVVAMLLLLIAATNATSLIMESLQAGEEVRWIDNWATELTAVIVVPLLFPPLFYFLGWLNLGFDNLRWRVLWHIPGFVLFSVSHIVLFNLLRKVLWTMAGADYQFGSVALGLIYEMRKGFWVYFGIVAIIYSYRFILDRLQGEARFLGQADIDAETPEFRDQFLVKMLDREYLVRVDEIEWIQSASNYVLLKCGERSYPMRQTLKALSEQLRPDRFQRVHRTAIVNLDQVVSLSDKGDSQLELRSGEQVPVSKTYLPELRQRLSRVAAVN